MGPALPLTAAFSLHSARLCPPLPVGRCPASAASFCHSLCLLLELSDLSRTGKGLAATELGGEAVVDMLGGVAWVFLSLSADALA